MTYLEQARAMGASLVVAVNTDDSVRRLGKGDDRPINTCEDRMAVLAALESVSAVVPFGEDTAQAIVRECRPDIYVKGGDYEIEMLPETKLAAMWGGRAEVVHFEHECSTTGLLSRIRNY